MTDQDYLEVVVTDVCEIVAMERIANVYQLRKGKVCIEVVGEEHITAAEADFRYKDSTLSLQIDIASAKVSVYLMQVGFGWPCYVVVTPPRCCYGLQTEGVPLTFNLADPDLFDKLARRCDRAIMAVKRKVGVVPVAACNPAKWRRYMREFAAAPQGLERLEWVEDLA